MVGAHLHAVVWAAPTGSYFLQSDLLMGTYGLWLSTGHPAPLPPIRSFALSPTVWQSYLPESPFHDATRARDAYYQQNPTEVWRIAELHSPGQWGEAYVFRDGYTAPAGPGTRMDLYWRECTWPAHWWSLYRSHDRRDWLEDWHYMDYTFIGNVYDPFQQAVASHL